MRAIITVVGKDSVGIISRVSAKCAEHGVNIIDISQSVMRDYFAMIMLTEIEAVQSFEAFGNDLKKMGEDSALQIDVMHEDIFNAMHRI